MKKVLLIATLLLASCDINPSKFGKEEAASFASKITYTQDHRTGLCFAIVASRKTANVSQSGIGMSRVPCSAVEDQLK
jgi:hypothetical protein